MSYYARKAAEKEAYKMVPETCPHVENALAFAEKKIKEQTEMLREALCDQIQRAMEAEDRVAELERDLELLKKELSV